MTWLEINLIVIDVIVGLLLLLPAGFLLFVYCISWLEEYRWKKHCRNCRYFVRIQHEELDSFHKRGVVCSLHCCSGEYIEEPLKCNYRTSTSDEDSNK